MYVSILEKGDNHQSYCIKLKVFDALNGVSEHFTVYAKYDVPTDLHYRNNDRIAEIVIIVEQGWFLKSVRPLAFIMIIIGM